VTPNPLTPAQAGAANPTGAQNSLAPWSLFAALIAAAGLPIYIHAPNFYVKEYGLSLASLGGTLALLRLIDVVQDPLLGYLAERGHATRRFWVAFSSLCMATAGLFAVTPLFAPLLWFALTLTLLFSAFSFLTICFYAEGVGRAARIGPTGHLRLAGWRETGSLIGICIASVAPVALASVTLHPFAAFAYGFAALALLATLGMRHEWGRTTAMPADTSPFATFRPALSDPLARRLLFIALLNAAPVAVTSTLFLFFVESRLNAPTAAGPLLLLFFLAAATSTPVWSSSATKYGPKPTLMAGMTLAIAAFLGAATLTTGDTLPFAVICAASGAALGADMTLLPAIFARRLAAIGKGGESAAFGLWSFVSKLSLALAAATLLPTLQWQGFRPGATNTAQALNTLTLLYALLPCALKCTAIALLARTPIPKD
jgi:glycoside/pentoside/hexuronide:cation symporter, GPH family